MKSPPSYFRFISAWIEEFIWIFLFFLQIPLLLCDPLFSSKVKAGRKGRAVIIVRDLACSRILYLRLNYYLRRAGFTPVYAPLLSPFQSLQKHADRMAIMLEKRGIRAAILLGHGAGGLSALAMQDRGRRRIQRLATMGTPFHGSLLYRPFFFLAVCKDMLPHSAFLEKFRVHSMLFPFISPFTAWQDECIFPSRLNLFGQGQDLRSDIPGHFNLILHGGNLRMIAHTLERNYSDPTPSTKKAEQKIQKPKRRTNRQPADRDAGK